MGIHRDKYTKEYFTGIDETGKSVGYGATLEKDDEGIWCLRSHDKIILDSIDFNKKRVLDLGFGRGEAICHAHLSGATECVGVDFSNTAIELASNLLVRRELPKTNLICADAIDFVREYAQKLKFDKNLQKFDIVIMLNFVEHIPRFEFKEMLGDLKKIISVQGLLVLNTPAYKFDNDVIKNGFDERNLIDCFDTSDVVPETEGMHCNKYSVISLQQFLSDCGYINLTEAHFYVQKSLFNQEYSQISQISYSKRWKVALELGVPIKNDYIDDFIEYPCPIIEELKYEEFFNGNMSGLTLLLPRSTKETVFSKANYDKEMFSTIKTDEIDGKVVFDVGAYIGVSSLIFAKIAGPNGKVIAFEPNPWNRNRIFLNLSHNPIFANNIFLFTYALGDLNQKSTMVMSSEIDTGFSSTSRLSVSHPTIRSEDLPKTFFVSEVEICTLDWFVETYKLVPNIIKIDIEGAEHLLLLGAIKTINQYKPVLYIELHSEFCALQCSLILNQLGYIISVLNEEADNRLMVKAIYDSQKAKIDHVPNDYDLIKILSLQLENTVQIQRVIQEEVSDYRETQTKFRESQIKLQILQEKNQNLQSEVKNLQSNNMDLQAELQVHQEKNQNLQSEFQILQSNNIDLQAQFQKLQFQFQELQTELNMIQLVNKELRQKEISDKEAKVLSFLHKINDIRFINWCYRHIAKPIYRFIKKVKKS